MPYAALEQYGLIGNMRTAALVSSTGSIDWLCLPRFDSPSVFCAILDHAKGGRFAISPSRDATGEQVYWPDTNILVTRHLTDHGVAETIDFMPVARTGPDASAAEIVRIVRGLGGRVELSVLCEPAFDFAREQATIETCERGVVFSGAGQRIGLSATTPLEVTERGVRGELALGTGECAAFFLRELDSVDELREPSVGRANKLMEETRGYWRRWISSCTYRGRWREELWRSALILKMLTYEPTGAIVAAPTCSLPAPVGGERNWDYRYTWLRDAGFTLYALMRIGFATEARAFMAWLIERCHELEPDGMLQPLYGIDGRHELAEHVLDHLDGYRGSRPVRVGNAAYQQLQLDTPGELMDAVYLFNKHVEPISWDLWTQLRRLLDWVMKNWQRSDRGIWEVRGPERQFVFSKLMLWVALDRGVRLADKRSLPGPSGEWRKVRDEIYAAIMRDGWRPSAGAFVQAYGRDALDASNLVMPLVFFVSPQDPRMVRTIEAIMKSVAEGGLTEDVQVFRYRTEQTDDGLPGGEAGFNICAFWLVEALTRAGRTDPVMLEQARILFEKLLACASPLGLYAEQTGSRAQQVGNYPQALTHLSFISAGFNLGRALDEK